MPLDPREYKNITDALAELTRRQSDLLQKASQADAASSDRKDLIGELGETTAAIGKLEEARRAWIKGV